MPLIHSRGLNELRLSAIPWSLSIPVNSLREPCCMPMIFACSFLISRGRLSAVCPFKCRLTFSQECSDWLYSWGVTKKVVMFQSHFKCIYNVRHCTSSSKSSIAFFKSTTLLLISSSMWVWAPQYTLRFLYMSGDSLFYVDEAVQNSCVFSFWRDEAERKEKCFNFTHRCKSLNCFKPSVTWGEKLFYIWKQRWETSNVSAWRWQWHPTPALLPGESHGWRSLVGCSPWGHWESGTTEWLHFHFSFSCIGEGNGNPLQCSCLESPRDGGAWWASVYGVAQSRTGLKWLSNSSSSSSNVSDKKSWKLYSYLAVCLISCNQFLCSVVLAWPQRTSVKVMVSKKLMKFLPVSVWPVQ